MLSPAVKIAVLARIDSSFGSGWVAQLPTRRGDCNGSAPPSCCCCAALLLQFQMVVSDSNCHDLISMPPKDKSVAVGGGAAPVATLPAPSPSVHSALGSDLMFPNGKPDAVGGGSASAVTFTALSPPGHSSPICSEGSSGSLSVSEPLKRAGQPFCDASPKRMIRNIVNISLGDWMLRCPEGSPPGMTGSGNTYAVVLDHGPCETVTTKKDNRKVARKTIFLGDCSGKSAEVTIWGNFAARSWMFPEGSVVLFKNLIFSSYFKNKMQMKFCDSDPAYELLITKAPDTLEITKQLKQWCVIRGLLL